MGLQLHTQCVALTVVEGSVERGADLNGSHAPAMVVDMTPVYKVCPICHPAHARDAKCYIQILLSISQILGFESANMTQIHMHALTVNQNTMAFHRPLHVAWTLRVLSDSHRISGRWASGKPDSESTRCCRSNSIAVKVPDSFLCGTLSRTRVAPLMSDCCITFK